MSLKTSLCEDKADFGMGGGAGWLSSRTKNNNNNKSNPKALKEKKMLPLETLKEWVPGNNPFKCFQLKAHFVSEKKALWSAYLKDFNTDTYVYSYFYFYFLFFWDSVSYSPAWF